MGGATAVIEGFDESLPLDTVNTVNVLIALFLPLTLAVLGVNTFQSLPIITISLTFFGLMAVSLLLTRGSVLSSGGTFTELSFGFIAGVAVFTLLRGQAGLSLFSLPTEQGSYLSILAQTPNEVQLLVNNIFAPYIETFALVSLAIITFILLNRNTNQSTTVSVLGAATLAALVFGFLHGARTLGFFLVAGSFMFASIYILLGEETGIVDVPYIGVSISFLLGLHLGNNLGATGGITNFYTTIISAPGPIGIIGIVITAWHLILLAGAGLFILEQV